MPDKAMSIRSRINGGSFKCRDAARGQPDLELFSRLLSFQKSSSQADACFFLKIGNEAIAVHFEFHEGRIGR